MLVRSLLLLIIVFGCIECVLAQDSVVILIEKASLRSNPDSRSKVIEKLTMDESYHRLKTSGEWSKIKTSKHTGWIETSLVYPVKSVGLPPSVLKDPKYDEGNGVGGGIGTGRGIGRGIGSGQGGGYGNGSGVGNGTQPPIPVVPTTPIQILSKPRPLYTDTAGKNNIQGVVTLRVMFLASGKIGGISVVKGLPFGLTEQAIDVARKVTFEPAKRDGVPVTVAKLLNITFNLY